MSDSEEYGKAWKKAVIHLIPQTGEFHIDGASEVQEFFNDLRPIIKASDTLRKNLKERAATQKPLTDS